VELAVHRIELRLTNVSVFALNMWQAACQRHRLKVVTCIP